MAQVEVEVKDGKIQLKSPYNRDIIDFCKVNAGRWDSSLKVWILDIDVISSLKSFPF